MNIYDLTNCPYSQRNGYYGGAAGDKDGIIIDGEPWICKYPKPIVSIRSRHNEKKSGFPRGQYLSGHLAIL